MPLDDLYKPVKVNNWNDINTEIKSTPVYHLYYIDLVADILREHYGELTWPRKLVYMVLCLIDMIFFKHWAFDYLTFQMLTTLNLVQLNIKHLEQAGNSICKGMYT